MSYLIAITGKGGTGKSTISSLLVRLFLEDGKRPVLAVDADPNSTLGPLLGVSSDEFSDATLSDIREDMLKQKATVTGISKDRILETKMEECLRECAGFDLLTMGRPEGPDCYCYVNNLLRGALTRLRSNYPVTIVDNEAGMEHLSRMNTNAIDCLVTVCEPTLVSAQAAARITALADGLPVTVHRRVLVWNKVPEKGVSPTARGGVDETRFDDVVFVPLHEDLADLSIEGDSVFKASRCEAFGKLLESCAAGLSSCASNT